MRRLAITLAVTSLAVLAASVSCSERPSEGEASLSAAAATLLPELEGNPERLPTTVEPDSAVVMMLVGVDQDGYVDIDGAPIRVASSALRFARAMAGRRTEGPRAWAMVREAGAEEIRYWIPLDPSALIRANVRVEEDASHTPHLHRVPTMYAALQLPFFPGGEVEFVREDGFLAGRFRFGDAPEQPLTELP